LPNREYDELEDYYEFDITYRPSIGTNTIIKTIMDDKDPFAIVQNCYRHMDVK